MSIVGVSARHVEVVRRHARQQPASDDSGKIAGKGATNKNVLMHDSGGNTWYSNDSNGTCSSGGGGDGISSSGRSSRSGGSGGDGSSRSYNVKK